jgi:hypothetical protein
VGTEGGFSMIDKLTFKLLFYSAWGAFWLMIFEELTR